MTKDLATLAWQSLLLLGAVLLLVLVSVFAVLRFLVVGLLLGFVIAVVINLIRGAFRS